MKLRIKFRKYGPVRFIGHLDVMRFFQKAIRRAEIDVAYTGGFSPHQVMSFAAPLGVGLESNGEYVDVEVHAIGSCQEVKDRLNAASVPGIEVVSVKVLPEDAGNAMASVAAAAYTVRFREGRNPWADTDARKRLPALEKLLSEFLSREEIPYVKETKKGKRECNLRPGIYRLTWDGDAFHMLLNASSAGNVKPVQVVTALLEGCGEVLRDNALSVTREDVYTDTGTEDVMTLTSLGEIGSHEQER